MASTDVTLELQVLCDGTVDSAAIAQSLMELDGVDDAQADIGDAASGGDRQIDFTVMAGVRDEQHAEELLERCITAVERYAAVDEVRPGRIRGLGPDFTDILADLGL